MKRFTLFAAVGLLALVGTDVAAQDNQAAIARALAAAPGRTAEGAAVIRWNADYTHQTLKEGTNRIVCYERTDEPRRPAFAVQCTSVANLPRAAQNRRFRMESANADEERAKVTAAEADGSRVLPEYGSVWVSMNGDDQASAGTHSTVAVPMATTATTGLPDNGRQGGAWIMGAGTSTAHIMVPGH
jgi:hypothetical protein